ncbi:TPA: hypothetical protein ACS70J_003749 [Providencia alcalifaciens]
MNTISSKNLVDEIHQQKSYQEGHFAILNATSDKEIARIYVKHTSKAFPNNDISYEVKDLGQLMLSEKIWFPYETSTYDYWYIEVDCYSPNYKPHLLKYKTKSNFYCNTVAKDNGLVLISIYLNDLHEPQPVAEYARIDFSDSSGCEVSLHLQP